MIARLLALVLAVSFSASAFALEDNSEELIKKFSVCNELQAAKHVGLVVIVAVGALFSEEIRQSMAKYDAQMARAKTCAQYEAAYKTLEDIFVKETGKSADSLFSSRDGQAGLEDIIVKMRKLK